MTDQTTELRQELSDLLKQVERAAGRLRYVLDHLVESDEARTDDAGGQER